MAHREQAEHRLLLIWQHAGKGESQRLFEVLGRQPGVRLRVLGPRRGYCTMAGNVVETRNRCGNNYDLVSGRVWRAMRDCGGPYLTRLLREMLLFRPEIVQVVGEPYTSLHAQVLLYRRLLLPRARVFGMSIENIIPRYPASRWDAIKRDLAHKESDGIACWSKICMAGLKDAGFPPAKLHLTYWGMPQERFVPARNEPLRKRLGLHDAFVLGFVGRIELQKSLWTVLLALKRLPSSVKFLCAGDGRWRQGFEGKVRELGLHDRVVLVGTVSYDDVPAYMNAMDALTLPSETTPTNLEQFGRVLGEAMACGVPVIGSDCGAIPEVIGDAGLVFPERDFVALACVIQRLLTDADLRRRLISLGLERSRGYLSFDALCVRLLQMYGLVHRDGGKCTARSTEVQSD
jgi:L-malate glycosyltransferase